MNEAIAVRDQSSSKIRKHPVKESKESWLETISRLMYEYKVRKQALSKKYSWFDFVYKWVIPPVLVILIVLCFVWRVNVYAENKAERLAAIALADYQAEQLAIAEARQAEIDAITNSEEAIIQREAELCAKLLFGINNFIEKYGYSEADLITYLRCVFDRVENERYGSTIADVIQQKDQWVGYSDNNPVLRNYYDIALKAVSDWHSETTKPVSNDFVYAELTKDGIWLKNDFNANAYSRRYRAT